MGIELGVRNLAAAPNEGSHHLAQTFVGQPHDRTVIARSARRGEPPSRRR